MGFARSDISGPGENPSIIISLGHEIPGGDSGLAPALGEVIPFFAYSPEVREILCTTNDIESLHRQVRKDIRDKGHFSSDQAATKFIYPALTPRS